MATAQLKASWDQTQDVPNHLGHHLSLVVVASGSEVQRAPGYVAARLRERASNMVRAVRAAELRCLIG
jgi:hypothetical protein